MNSIFIVQLCVANFYHQFLPSSNLGVSFSKLEAGIRSVMKRRGVERYSNARSSLKKTINSKMGATI